MDAIRIQDGLPVILKMVHPIESPHELSMNRRFQSLARMPDNHCLPMLDDIKLQCSGSQHFMVFPHLPPFHRSRIRTFEDFIVFITQISKVWPASPAHMPGLGLPLRSHRVSNLCIGCILHTGMALFLRGFPELTASRLCKQLHIRVHRV